MMITMNGNHEESIKICRQCHTIYKSLNQKYCGNGCARRPPFLIDGEANTQIEPREITCPHPKDGKIRWKCIHCLREYDTPELESRSWVCKCGIQNDVYPFTIKSCANSECFEADIPHILHLEAKTCDLCGKSDFILNKTKNTTNFLISHQSENVQWPNLQEYKFQPHEVGEPENKSMLSLQLTILNNNLELQTFGKNLTLTIQNIIQESPGFIPDSIYLKYINHFGLTAPIFCFKYEKEREEYIFTSKIPTECLHLDSHYHLIGSPQHVEEDSPYSIQENAFLLIKAGFFKLRIWVY